MSKRTSFLLSPALLLLLSSCLTAPASVRALNCPGVDIENVAYLFTRQGDYRLPAADGGNASAQPELVASSGTRPAFTGNFTQCFTNQFTNGLYVTGADDSAPNDVYVYDFAGNSWTTQQTSGGPTGNYVAILDHDTNVLYAYVNGTMSALSFDQTAPRSTGATLEWLVGAANNDVPFDTSTYAQPVLGAANNHIQFLNTPASAPGEAYIFVIHYAYWQPEVQSFGDFPVGPGQTVTIFSNSSAAPPSFVYIPDAGNGTYVVNARTNTTTTFPAPPSTDPLARYAASTTALYQLAQNGSYASLDLSSAGAAWRAGVLASSNGTAGNSTGSAAAGTAAQSGSATAAVGSAGNKAGSAPAAGTTGNASALRVPVVGAMLAVLLLAGFECLL